VLEIPQGRIASHPWQVPKPSENHLTPRLEAGFPLRNGTPTLTTATSLHALLGRPNFFARRAQIPPPGPAPEYTVENGRVVEPSATVIQVVGPAAKTTRLYDLNYRRSPRE